MKKTRRIPKENTVRVKVLRALHAYPEGLTSYQVAVLLDTNVVNVSPYFASLERDGLCLRAGKQGKRTIWQVTQRRRRAA